MKNKKNALIVLITFVSMFVISMTFTNFFGSTVEAISFSVSTQQTNVSFSGDEKIVNFGNGESVVITLSNPSSFNDFQWVVLDQYGNQKGSSGEGRFERAYIVSTLNNYNPTTGDRATINFSIEVTDSTGGSLTKPNEQKILEYDGNSSSFKLTDELTLKMVNVNDDTFEWYLEYPNSSFPQYEYLNKKTARVSAIFDTEFLAEAYELGFDDYNIIIKDIRKYPLIDISSNKIETNLNKGESETLQINYNPVNTTDDKSINWSSEDPAIATVDSLGNVTAVEKGTTNIVAKVQDKIIKTKITVNIPLSTILFEEPIKTMNLDEKTVFKVNYEPLNTTEDKTIIWSSSNPSVAKVDSTGTVTALKGGITTISATVGTKTVSHELKVLSPLVSIQFDKKNVILQKNSNELLKVAISPLDTTDSKTITWTSSNKAVATVDSTGKVIGVQSGNAIITAKIGDKKIEAFITVSNTSISYSTHVQSIGWLNPVTDGALSGTAGKGKRMEAIKIDIKGNSDLGIQYSTHVQSYGWMDWVSDGTLSGTSGKAKRLEAIKLKLTGADADNYDVYYRVHAEKNGWLGWAKNGEEAGTEGFGRRLEAVEIVVVEKGASAPGSTANAFVKKELIPTVSYTTHVQSFGWQSWVKDGTTAGTSGKAKRLEGIKIKLENMPYAGGVQYKTHVQSYGWQGWSTNSALSGTSGKAKRLEAIQIQLTGEMAEKYDVYYRVHAQSYGWLGWAKNGESSGTEGKAKRLEGVEIQLVKKGEKAPSSKVKSFIK